MYGADYNQAIRNYWVFYGLFEKCFDESNPQVPITVIAHRPGTVKTFIHSKNLPLIIKLYGRLTGGDTEHGAGDAVFPQRQNWSGKRER